VQIASIGETDGIRERTSKKDGRVREEEVRRCASLGLIGWVERQARDVLRHASGCLVIAEIMLFAEGGGGSFFLTGSSFLIFFHR